jgi:hypothetical protein
VCRRLFGLLVAAAAFPAVASASPVLVLGPNGRFAVRDDPFLRAEPATPLPAVPSRPRRARARLSAAAERTVQSELRRFYRRRLISRDTFRRYNGSFGAALAAVRQLSGSRATELESVVLNLHDIAAAGLLTTSRLPVLFETLDRNRQWWTTGPLLSYGQRVEFGDSDVVWEYYPGQGIELQPLGTFGKADGLYTAGPAAWARLRRLIAEMLPLAAWRGGGLAWEYYFNFEGGTPPWTSAMSQATAIEALTRAFQAFHDGGYLSIARRALTIFTDPPPVGVSVPTRLGRRYLLYSFAPDQAVINGFLQTLIGLYDYAHASGDRNAARLFAAGDAEARAELPAYDTGAWSLYEPGQEDTLDYHTLVTGFLQELCARTAASVYCATAQRFQADLKTPPALALLTGRVRAGRASSVAFRLSKMSHVGIVIARGSQTVFLTSADFGYGVQSFSVPALSPAGVYDVRLAATDLAGNFARIEGTLTVSG